MNFLNDFLWHDMLAANCQNRLVIVYKKYERLKEEKFYGRGCVCWFDGACIFVNYIFARQCGIKSFNRIYAGNNDKQQLSLC